jgi:hypothetical protein
MHVGRPEPEELAQARERLEILRASLGDRHPDYAGGLNHLALLLIVNDEASAAEPLLREALAIRKDASGEDHPEYANTLSSLAGLLWARGDLAGAEPLLRQALEIRWRVFGPDQPKTVASLNRLEQLLQERRDLSADGPRPEATTEVRPDATGAEDSSPGATSNDLSYELAVLSDVFADLGERLGQAARRLREPGTPPPESLVEELSACRRDFASLRDRAGALAGSLRVARPTVEDLKGLQDVAALLDEIAGAEIRQAGSEEFRRRALASLDRVLRLSHVGDADFPALCACQDRARALQRTIAASPWTELPAEAGPLAEGDHAFAHLLALIVDRDELDDGLEAHLHASVASAFGTSLADDAVQGQLALPPDDATARVG